MLSFFFYCYLLTTSQYDWDSAHVLAPLILGLVLMVAFCVWEAKFAKFPMFPRRLVQVPNIMVLTLVITFISGANFFSILMFWPTQGMLYHVPYINRPN